MAPQHQHQRYWMEETQPPSNAYTYVPIDPFKPSIAFSLRKLSAQEDANLLEDDRPPIRRGPQSRPTRRAYSPPGRPSRSPPPLSRSRFQSRPTPTHVPSGGCYPQERPPTPYRPSRSPPPPPPLSRSPRRRRSRSRSYSPVRNDHHSPIPAPSPSSSSTEGTDKESQVQDHASAPLTLSPYSSPRHSASSLSTSESRVRQYDFSRRPVTPSKARSTPSAPPSPPPPRPADDVESTADVSYLFSASLLSIHSGRKAARDTVPPRRAYDLAGSPEPSQSSTECSSSEGSPRPAFFPRCQFSLPPPVAPVAPAPLPLKDELESSFNNKKNNNKPPKDDGAYAYASAFVLDTLPRQIYLNLLLRLPYLYFSRVTRIFEEAEMSMPMIRQGILDAARARARARVGADGDGRAKATANGKAGWSGYGKYREMDRQMQVETERYFRIGGQKSMEPELTKMDDNDYNEGYVNLQMTWLAFVDALLKEWKTLNIISVLLLSAILTLLQIQSIANDPVTRYSALLSMICALISLMYGCIYIIRFGTMKKTYKGAAWAQEAQRQKAGIWWNIWVMLALPAAWLAWSVIFYITTITAFIWRSSPYSDLSSSSASSSTATGTPIAIPSATSPQLLIPRLLLTAVLAMGVVYSILIASTLRRYGESMDRAWQERIWVWMRNESESYGDEVREVCRCEACEAGKAGVGVSVDDKVKVVDVDADVGFGDQVCRCEMCIGGGVGVDKKVEVVDINVGVGVGAGDKIGEVCRCETCVRFGSAVDEKVKVVDADVDVGVREDRYGYVGSLTKEWVEDHLARRTNNEDFFINEDVIEETSDIAGEGGMSTAERDADQPIRHAEWPSDPAPLPPIHEHEDEHKDEYKHEVPKVRNGSHLGTMPQIRDVSEVVQLRNATVYNTEAVGEPQGSMSTSTLGLSFVEEASKFTTPPGLTSTHQTDSKAADLG